ncbi:MAG: lysophospholipid acyltransferase family protein [Anaerolineae bacterium]
MKTVREPPHYRMPLRVIRDMLWATITGRSRSLALDAQHAMAAISAAPVIVGADHIPARGPCLITCNHYTRPGLGAWWIAVLISASIASHRAMDAPSDVHWVMTDAWRYPQGDWRRHVVTPASRWAISQVARMYDLVTMPAMPPDPAEVKARAVSVLRAVRMAKRLAAEGGLLGLAPEGRDTPGPIGMPPAGAGEFIALLVRTGLPVLPVALAEVADRLRVSFGPPFVPDVPDDRTIRDQVVIDQVMVAIADQLPKTSDRWD